ncbi:MAG TPA: cation diffusion facilitator family transporter [Polyangiaceae bacterium]|nr:cation diffusion facilitator family transporter [Polyangiaceae bacterium]
MSRRAVVLSRAVLAGSALFSAGLFAAHMAWGSAQALAQGADSLLDCAGAIALAYAVRVARQPRDAGHPFGHTRAEPLGALATAMLASLLAFEVLSTALSALWSGASVDPEWGLLAAFLGKVAFKGVVFSLAVGREGPALEALVVDARNDMLLGSVAVLSFGAARLGWVGADAWLSLPVAVYIGYSGFSLARENVDRLMGRAPEPERLEELTAVAGALPGVLAVSQLRAQFLGSELSVEVDIVVDSALTVGQAHDIGEAVQERVEAEPDVVHCAVHIDPT